MSFLVRHRYGSNTRHGDDADVPAVVDRLLRELECEQFEEDDDEHTEVSIERDDWGLSVWVSGLLSLGDLSWITGSDDDKPLPEACRRATDRAEAARVMALVASGRAAEVLASPGWMAYEQVPPEPAVGLFRRAADDESDAAPAPPGG